MRTDLKTSAEILKNSDNILILTHASPDGDTLGSGFGLCRALRLMGKKANVICNDTIPRRYDFLREWYSDEDFEIKTIISVDVADKKLLGKNVGEKYGNDVLLCIDHHITNTEYAKYLMLGEKSASACEVIFKVLKTGDFPIDGICAMCLYTGTATDTGCFKFDSVTPETHIIASELMRYEFPVSAAKINRMMFDVKTPSRMKAEQLLIKNAEIFCDTKAVITYATLEEQKENGLSIEDFDGIASVPMQFEGAEIAVTVREKEKNKFKISARSESKANVSEMCQKFGGGGHVRAAGCTIDGELSEVIQKLKEACRKALENVGE